MSRNLRALLFMVIVVGCALLLMPRERQRTTGAPTAVEEPRSRRQEARANAPERERRRPRTERMNRTDMRRKLPKRGTPERPTPPSERLVPPTNPERAARNEQQFLEAEPKTRESVRGSLRQELPRQLPDAKLSAEQYERLTDAVMRYRATQRVIDGMPPSNENQEVLLRTYQEVTEIMREINEITGASAADLTAPDKPWMQ